MPFTSAFLPSTSQASFRSMDALHRTTSHLLEPLFALIAAWTPKPIIITDNTVFVNVVAHVPVLILAFLLFSPTSTRRVRAALAPVAVAATLRLGFTFRHAGAIWGERNKGLSMTATYWAMKAVELALRSERPAWLGWETDAGDAREKRRTEANRVDTWRRRAYLALTYSYVRGISSVRASHRRPLMLIVPRRPTFCRDQSYRSLGWSTGPSKTRFAVPKVPVLRRRVLVRHLGRAVFVYLLMDALHGLFALHPSFSTLASARSASLYEPLVLPYLPPIPPLASATVVSIGWATALYLAQAFPPALVGFASALLSPDWRTTELHYPTLFRDWWAAESIGDIWGVRWHKLYFATLLFNGYRLPARIGGRLAGVVGTLCVLHHVVCPRADS
jgi:hypothetical protein